MFRDVPECSGMFQDIPCSWFYRRLFQKLDEVKLKEVVARKVKTVSKYVYHWREIATNQLTVTMLYISFLYTLVIDKNIMNFALKLKIGYWKFALKFSSQFCFQITIGCWRAENCAVSVWLTTILFPFLLKLRRAFQISFFSSECITPTSETLSLNLHLCSCLYFGFSLFDK